MLKSKIFETSFALSDVEGLKLNNMLVDKKTMLSYDELIKLRKVKVDIWKDIFEKYFDNSITHFIKNRNHVAHNKLLTNASFEKMKQDILEANELFRREEPSNELNET